MVGARTYHLIKCEMISLEYWLSTNSIWELSGMTVQWNIQLSMNRSKGLHVLLAAKSLPLKTPCTRWVGLTCWRSSAILLYANTAASRAFWPSHGLSAAWALHEEWSAAKWLGQCDIRMTGILDFYSDQSKATAQAHWGLRSGCRMTPMVQPFKSKH